MKKYDLAESSILSLCRSFVPPECKRGRGPRGHLEGHNPHRGKVQEGPRDINRDNTSRILTYIDCGQVERNTEV